MTRTRPISDVVLSAAATCRRRFRVRVIVGIACAAAIAWLDVLCVLPVWGEPASSVEFSSADIEFFTQDVQPLLKTHCYECHGSDEAEGGLRLTSRVSLLAGGDTGPAIVPGDPEESLLIDAIEYGELYEMPPKSKLALEDIATLREWVRRGAPWTPGSKTEDTHSSKAEFDIDARKASHWSWRPVESSAVPKVNDANWPSDPLDNFVLARLEAAGLAPASPADPRALVRRVYFDLIGLPPTVEDVEAFAADPTAHAFHQIVDDLLASPQFGERWGRHWLDLMRYVETRGHEFDFIIPNAWQYRDYVIRAFNADVPYDQFVTEHVAGDLLSNPRRHPVEGYNESVLATGFWYLGDWVHSPVDIRKDETDRFDNAIDVYSKAFLGLTVACARCHDHKFDAIAQRDYYSLAGFLQSSAYRQVRFETEDHNRRIATKLGELRQQAGRKLIHLVVGHMQAVRQQLPMLLTAATEALEVSQSSESAAELDAIAARHGVPVARLAEWVSELRRAGNDEQHPLHALWLSAAHGFAEADRWAALQRATNQARFDATHQVVVDYDSPTAQWLTDGPAYGGGPLTRGAILLGTTADHPIAEIVTVGRAEFDPELGDLQLHDGAELPDGKLKKWHPRSGRVLRAPTKHLEQGKLYYLMRGGARIHAVVDSHRMINGPLHGSTLKEVPFEDKLRWVEHDLSRYSGHGVQVEFAPIDENPLQVYLVLEGSVPPKEVCAELGIAAPLIGATRISEVISRTAAEIENALDCMTNRPSEGSRVGGRIVAWAANHPQLWAEHPSEDVAILLDDYHTRRQQLIAQIKKTSAIAPAIWDGTPEDERLLVRGNAAAPREEVPRQMLTAIAGRDQEKIRQGSGRLELAARTVATENPLPARVMVNRIWHHLLGRGIVPTVDNFGVLGQLPTHPELLDHLAVRFVEGGWSMKQMIRTLVLSSTYQMSSRQRPGAAGVDPLNLLYHRIPIKRLEAEAIRDALLTVSGRLDPQQFGPSVPVHLTEFMQGRGRPKKSGPADGGGRRSIYQAVRRNFLSPMMTTFDAPQPTGPCGRRTVSNVPAQALMLLNAPFVHEQAKMFADRLTSLEPNDNVRIERLYAEALARPPLPAELQAAQEFLRQQTIARSATNQAASAEQAAWMDLCHAIFNTKEFVFLR